MHKGTMRSLLVFAGLAGALLSSSAMADRSRMSRNAPGNNLDVVQANCSGCHSADYIKTQPRGEKFKKNFWQAEVTKMVKIYGAPIDEADVGKIVDYLAESY